MKFPSAVTTALNRLSDAGFESYPVGGCVRDFLRGVTPFDFDITTSALPTQVKDLFFDFQVIETGLKHGTVTVLIDEIPLEITTFRTDLGYSDGRHPDKVAFAASLREDLARRDFTINALAWGADGVIDYYGGTDDLSAKTIRCVGDAKTRFTEDALRILRGLRFASTLDFHIEDETARAMLTCAHLLSRVSTERVCEELSRLVCGAAAERVVRAFYPVFRAVLPNLSTDFSRLSALPPDKCLRLAAFLGNTDSLSHLKLSAHDTRLIKTLLTADPPVLLTRYAALACKARYKEHAQAVCAYHGVTNLEELCGDGIWEVSQLAIGGGALTARGYHGKAVGDALSKLLLRVMRGELENTQEALLCALED